MNNDPTDLPMRAAKLPAKQTTMPIVVKPTRAPATVPTQTTHPALTNEQFTTLVDRSATVVVGAFEIAKMLVETQRIQVQSRATVNEIGARSDALERAMREATEQLMVERKTIRTRGEAAVAMIEMVLKHIPETDHASRQVALKELTVMVKTIVSRSDSEPPHQT